MPILNMARCYLYRGDFELSEKRILKARWSDASCLIWWRLGAETFETYANLYRERGDFEKANEYYERAARAYDDAGINLARTELFEERAVLSLQLGDFNAARHQIDRLISSRPVEKDEMGFYTASLTRGRIMTAQGDFEAALQRPGRGAPIFSFARSLLLRSTGLRSDRSDVITRRTMSRRCWSI